MAGDRLWRCEICGYVHQGQAPPDRCPVCFAGPEAFTAQGPELPGPSAPQTGGRIVVVGGGVAGLAAADSARARDAGSEIVLLSGERAAPYNRLELTRYLAGETDSDRLPLQAPDWYAEHRIELRFGEAIELDRAGHSLGLRGGQRLAYDRLVLATGAHPTVPPIPGLHGPRIFRFRTRADADALLSVVRPGLRALCLGGGLLGLECAAGLARRGMAVRILESAACLLPRQLAPGGARLLERHLKGLGVETTCGVAVKEVRERRTDLEIRLDRHGPLAADLLLLAVGITPETFLARESGLEVDRGIRVDDAMTTSDPAIFACGDVAEHRGVLYGLWEAARAQGVVAGACAAGAKASFEGIPPTTFLKVVGLDLFSCGAFLPAGEGWESREACQAGNWQRLTWREGRLVGANLVGDVRAGALLREAVQGSWTAGKLVEAAPPDLAQGLLPAE